MQCPSNSFRYNTTLCACNPGYLYNATGNTCSPFTVSGKDQFLVGSGVDYSINLPENIFSFDSITKYTQSQAVFLEATLVMLVGWLLFCFLVRFGSLGDGRTPWFKIRWWISRLDICFATRHWLDDQKVVKKRKTELGGAFSIASWILFIGLFAALLYQIISRRSVEMHSVKATNAPDLDAFNNDMEFNITTISSMSCSNVQGLGTIVTGNPGFINFRTAPLSTFANFSCHNTTKGPTITLKCTNCKVIRDNIYISWQFVDLPNMPASAVGFEFNLTARDHDHTKHLSYVSGTLKNGSTNDEKFITYRGRDPNILQFNLFPRIYKNKHNLRLIQPLFHEFLPGSSFSDVSQLRDSLQSSNDGLVNTTLYINYLSSYLVEVTSQNVLGPVGFLADLGGLYCISVGIFFYFMVQFEYRFKKFRYEDNVVRSIRSRRKAQERWDKLRKYVIFTWGRSPLPLEDGSYVGGACCTGFMNEALPREGSTTKRRQHIRKDTISLNTKVTIPSEKKSTPERIQTQEAKRHVGDSTTPAGKFSSQELQTVSQGYAKRGDEEKGNGTVRFKNGPAPQQQVSAASDIPLPPTLGNVTGAEVSVSDIHKNLENLYQYNVMLRQKLIDTQSMIHELTSKATPSPSGQR